MIFLISISSFHSGLSNNETSITLITIPKFTPFCSRIEMVLEPSVVLRVGVLRNHGGQLPGLNRFRPSNPINNKIRTWESEFDKL